MNNVLRWGILGSGNIARQFAADLHHTESGQLTAVGSRTLQSAAAFSAQFKIDHGHDNYEALITDEHVDAVYISLPNSLHHKWTLRALAAGKHVLCEKPMALNAEEAEQMFEAAQTNRRLLVEAFMYRTHPLTREVVKHLHEGRIGKLQMIRTSFCFCIREPMGNIRLNATLGGGSLMDVGSYCINFSRHLTGCDPVSVQAVAHKGAHGVDDYIAGTLAYTDGVISTFTCGMTVHANNMAQINGSNGFIEVPVPWKPPMVNAKFMVKQSTPTRQDRLKVSTPAATTAPQTHNVDANKPLYALEADAFAAVIQGKAKPFVTAQETLGNMRVLDRIRHQIGLEFK